MAQDFKASATAAGIPWQQLIDWIKGMNWLQLIQFIQQIISIFRNKPVVAKATKGCGPDDVDCIKAHFDCIEAMAECGKHCCDNAPATAA